MGEEAHQLLDLTDMDKCQLLDLLRWLSVNDHGNVKSYLVTDRPGGDAALAEAILSAIALGIQLERVNPESTKSFLTEMARKGALGRIAADPKQAEKSFVYGCWQAWQNEPERYPSKAAFGRDMLDKCEHLTSQKKIEDWCRDWEKANPAG